MPVRPYRDQESRALLGFPGSQEYNQLASKICNSMYQKTCYPARKKIEINALAGLYREF
jgi:hypothetical protein